jgi:death-on-curing protein
MTFDGKDLYPSVTEKAATLGFSLIQNHPFVDGNKRIGHAAMEVFLIMNGYEIKAHVDVQEKMILKIASGQNDRSSLEKWLKSHIVKVN